MATIFMMTGRYRISIIDKFWSNLQPDFHLDDDPRFILGDEDFKCGLNCRDYYITPWGYLLLIDTHSKKYKDALKNQSGWE